VIYDVFFALAFGSGGLVRQAQRDELRGRGGDPYLVAAYAVILPRYLSFKVLASAGFSWLWSRYQDGRHPPEDEPHVGNASA
jgi:hypothetical protein